MTDGHPRLLMVSTVPQTLGFLTVYADHFRARGWRVDAATGPGDACLWASHFDQLHRVPWSRRPADLGNATTAVAGVRRLLRAGDHDVVHTHTPIASLVTRTAMATLRRRPASVYTAHGFHFHRRGRAIPNRVFHLAEAAAASVTDRLVVINREDQEAAERFWTLPASRVRLFDGIGIDLDHYRPSPCLREAARRVPGELGLPVGARLVSMIAELVPRKDHATALRALATHEDRALHLALAGDGPLRGALLAQAHRSGIAERVHFLGPVRDVRPLMLASRATVLPSRREGLARAVLESLALGVPVLGARSRGVEDLLLDGGGLLVEPGDAEGLAEGFDLVEDLPRGEALREVLLPCLQRYSIERLLRAHEALYEELLSGARHP